MTAAITNTLTAGPSGAVFRSLTSLLIASSVTVCLFWVMQTLIETADRNLNHEVATTLLEFVRVERDETINDDRIEKPDIPDKPEKQPPQPPEIVGRRCADGRCHRGRLFAE